MSIDIALLLMEEMKEYGCTLAELIKNNKVRSLEHPKDAYFFGKIDAYEVALEDFVKRLKKVNSYGRSI